MYVNFLRLYYLVHDFGALPKLKNAKRYICFRCLTTRSVNVFGSTRAICTGLFIVLIALSQCVTTVDLLDMLIK